MKSCILYLVFSFCLVAQFFAQNGKITGKVIDKETNEAIPMVNILVKNTPIVVQTDIEGKYEIDIKPGEYTIEVKFIGYADVLITGIKVKKGEVTVQNIVLNPNAYQLDVVEVIGEKPLVDTERSASTITIDEDLIRNGTDRKLENILATQTGVIMSNVGVHIRGGRTNETGYYVDGVNAQDPLAGTGFGLDLGGNAISSIDVNTSGASAEFGDATAGTVNVKTKSGGDKFELFAAHKRDNFWNSAYKDWQSVFNQSVYELSFGGPDLITEKLLPKWNIKFPHKIRYQISTKATFSDEYFKNPAKQIYSSTLNKNTFWTPYNNNRWNALAKLNYDINPRQRLAFTYMRSINVNQDRNMLRIVTNSDVGFAPGYQFPFQLQMDNANVYTHQSSLIAANWNHTVGNRVNYTLTVSRLFVDLRADANGRDWRPKTVNEELDPNSIVTFPVLYYNPGSDTAFVNPAPGLINNGGIATLWHDHYAEEYATKGILTIYSKNSFNKFQAGFENKMIEYQWIDIIRPWIGAPIDLGNGQYSQSFRLGDASDVWKVRPAKGSLFVNDQIKYKGLIANVGLRFEYWWVGKFVDDAVENPISPIRDEIREQYRKETTKVFGARAKARLLPKLSASFPIRPNQVLYFNYGHNMIQPHPSFIYAGLNPNYQDQSPLGKLGNPNLNPEVTISYELGLNTQITSNDALMTAVFFKDRYDFVTSTSIIMKDITGREVTRTISINSDYARTRGIEVTYIKRYKKWFSGQIGGSYSLTTGQSSSSNEVLAEILQGGTRNSTKELPLAFDRPLDLKANVTFTLNNGQGLFGQKWLDKTKLYFEAVYRSGQRYTPAIQTGVDAAGRPIYEFDPDPNKRYSKIGPAWKWIDMNLQHWWDVQKTQIVLSLEITNILNFKNVADVNPVTGRAWEPGDDVLYSQRDPRFSSPIDATIGQKLPPDNPARYLQPRHFMLGIAVKY